MSNLTTMVKDITYFYIKYYYEKELTDTNQSNLTENEIKMLAAIDKYKDSDEDHGPF